MVLSGIIVTVLSGLVMGSSPWPLKLMHKFKYEHYAFISMLVALFVIPWLITLNFCPNVFSALGSVDLNVLIKANAFSFAWGVCQVLALLSFVRIGVSLTYGILVAIGACIQVVTPMIIKASGVFQAAPDLISKAGLTVLAGVAVMLLGISFASLSGFGRERLRKTEGKSSGFGVGLIMVVVAGVLSAGWSFAFSYSQGPVIAAVKAHGAGDFPANISVWASALLGAALVNTLYPAYLMTKNKSWNILTKSKRDIGLAVTYGVLFFTPCVMLGKGMLLLGVLGASVGIGINQGMVILGGQIVGFVSGEWRGITGNPRTQIYLAIAILIIATAIMALGNSLAHG